VDDYHWTKEVLNTCFDNTPEHFHGFMDGLSLHYYTLPETEDDWNVKGSATDFTEEVFYQTLKRSYFMEELINNHGAIMDQYDPEKKIGLMIDEWGIWTDVEPGTNPGFLYQQNTMRDALVAGMNLNIFNKHSDRVKMACIAQMINVLQSVMLTDGEKMIKTPTYYVFKMYRHHQGATLLGSDLLNGGTVGSGKNEVPKIFESVSEDADGVITITLTNNSLESSEDVDVQLTKDGGAYNVCEAVYVTGKMADHNTFDNPEVVKELEFKDYSKTSEGLKVTLPACSVVSIRLKK
jgi:alpha-N-arabinofuranosidase